MTSKTALSDVEPQIKRLNKRLAELEQVEKNLRESEQELLIRTRIAEVFLKIPDEDMYAEALKIVLDATGSKYGTFGYINQDDGSLVLPSLTKDVWDECQMPGKTFIFHKEKWGGIWGQALKEKKTLYSNSPFITPQGHIPIARAMAVPLLFHNKLIGMLHVANKQTDYSEKDKFLLEKIADYISPVLHARLVRDQQDKERKRAEEALKRNNEIQSVLNEMLSISTQPLSLEDILNHILDKIVSIPWLSLEAKGAILLVEDNPNELLIKAQRKLSLKLQTQCARVPFGKCLCGKAAATKQIQFADCIDQRHDYHYKGMSAHGHYCVPIVSLNRVLGVLNLYVRPNHKSNKEEQDFLTAISNVLAGIIERKQAEMELLNHRLHLENLVQERTIELTRTNKKLKQEIAERIEAEKLLNLEREKLQKVYENSPDAILVMDKNFKILYANQHSIEVSGVPKTEIINKKCHKIIMGCSSKCEGCLVDEVISEKKSKTRIKYEITATGIENWLWQIWYPALTPEGEVDCIVEIARDITEIKKTEQKLKQSEEKYRSLVDNVPDVIITIDKTGTIQFINHTVKGLVVENAIGTKIYDHLPPEYHELVAEKVRQAFLTGEVQNYESSAKTPANTSPWYIVRIIPVKENGRVISAIMVCTDISERKQIEQKLKLFRYLIDHSNDAIVVTDAKTGRFLDANQKACTSHGYTHEELLKGGLLKILALPTGFNHQSWAEHVKEVREKGNMLLEVLHKRKDNSTFPVEVSITFISYENNDYIVAISRDIAQSKRAEKNLVLFRGIINQTNESLFLIDNKTSAILDLNDKTCISLGYTRNELLSMKLLDIAEEIIPHNSSWENEIKKFQGDKVAVVECIYKRKDGSSFPVEITIRYVYHDGLDYLIIIARDITERKQAETKLKRVVKELERSNAELQQFVNVASHDLQEPLRMVTSYLQLLRRRYKNNLDGDANEFIDFAIDGATRMYSLINDLLMYSRVGNAQKQLEPTSCETAIVQVLDNLQTVIKEKQAVVTYGPMPTVMGDASQLIQLFQNLIGNSLKFQYPGTLPSVHISAKPLEDEWLFSIRDNGIGIAPEFFERIFKMFQRLHSAVEYPGTGIGLAICKKIVERHNGKIWLTSKTGEGTTFFFTVPKTRSAT